MKRRVSFKKKTNEKHLNNAGRHHLKNMSHKMRELSKENVYNRKNLERKKTYKKYAPVGLIYFNGKEYTYSMEKSSFNSNSNSNHYFCCCWRFNIKTKTNTAWPVNTLIIHQHKSIKFSFASSVFVILIKRLAGNHEPMTG